ncbi:MAG: hypothetical protein H5T68_07295 [Chloroflexi bacterium]|nr:hypothetical protein [Chloroflexota bacterium]
MEPDRYTTVLIAIMNNPRDLAIARDQHWYRIPVKHLPQRGFHAPILAFYQTKEFGEQKWSINYYAHTTTWEMVPRIQLLPDEPSHPRANELYYKVHLGELRTLPHPIVSRKWRRITFIVTHWGRLLEAQEINQLLHGSIWEERLWRALRRLGRLAEEDDFDW